MRFGFVALGAFVLGWLVRHGAEQHVPGPDLSEVRATLTACAQTIRECSRAIHADEREIDSVEEGWTYARF